MMPNALKLDESITETAREVPNEDFDWVILPISSGTIAAGVIQGFYQRGGKQPWYVIHLGYSRSQEEVERYLKEKSGVTHPKLVLVDEQYQYKDEARDGETPPWPCNVYYDLKAFRWWMKSRARYPGRALLWNIG